MKYVNGSQIAHIVSWCKTGPRGNDESVVLAADFDNLMLMCYNHHRLIDIAGVAQHSVDRLREMKVKHESRVRLLLNIKPENACTVITYSANIGDQPVAIDNSSVHNALLPRCFPDREYPISLGILSSQQYDHEDSFWENAQIELGKAYNSRVSPLLASGKTSSIAVFALAPQPLLIKLGTMISEVQAAEVFQKHRDPKSSWSWHDSDEGDLFIVEQPTITNATPILVISLSDFVSEERIRPLFFESVSLWRITIDRPRRDFLRTKSLLVQYRQKIRQLYSDIKRVHGQSTPLHVFPVMPNSAAIETGRCWNAKADMPLILYDQSAANGGFVRRLEINNKKERE